MIVTLNYCCHGNYAVGKWSIIYCTRCGAQLSCDGECGECDLRVRCLGLSKLPKEVNDSYAFKK